MLPGIVRICRAVDWGRMAVVISGTGLLLIWQAFFPASAWTLNANQLLIVNNRVVSSSERA
ncbi:hypothetical protein A7E78_13670 [Syntrophotalea acetylenivorans]|uniref:Uncharacterized protein n=1 Tax=Syntrophotalea acetylenivorans TaxID=1842532 RepID=A0A1L3GS73_9BACT|nr:hypothetical protein A7E78_13670 [Syntrophotalea acetylenivorans]